MVVILMGPAGVGKTTMGRQLATDLGWPFLDADSFHSSDDVERMRRGQSLTDVERWPWLERVRDAIRLMQTETGHVVVACSALKQRYRDTLARDLSDVRWVYLHAPATVLHDRLVSREGHFAGPEILDGQLRDLEPPPDAIVVDAALPVGHAVAAIRHAIGS